MSIGVRGLAPPLAFYETDRENGLPRLVLCLVIYPVCLHARFVMNDSTLLAARHSEGDHECHLSNTQASVKNVRRAFGSLNRLTNALNTSEWRVRLYAIQEASTMGSTEIKLPNFG